MRTHSLSTRARSVLIFLLRQRLPFEFACARSRARRHPGGRGLLSRGPLRLGTVSETKTDSAGHRDAERRAFRREAGERTKPGMQWGKEGPHRAPHVPASPLPPVHVPVAMAAPRLAPSAPRPLASPRARPTPCCAAAVAGLFVAGGAGSEGHPCTPRRPGGAGSDSKLRSHET